VTGQSFFAKTLVDAYPATGYNHFLIAFALLNALISTICNTD